MTYAEIAIVGGGLAGAAAAENYRKAGGTGTVTIISADEDLPVHRPPLSKEFLREGDESGVLIHPASFYGENGVDLRLGTAVEALDLGAKSVALQDGQTLNYSTLVLATGARPRHLDLLGADLGNVFMLRSFADSRRLRDAAKIAKRAVIVGAGFIGMEVAASLSAQGVECTVVEVGPRMWTRIAPEVVAAAIQPHFEARGVTFRFGAGLKALAGVGTVRSVLLDGGESLPADLVVIGAGVMLNTDLAEAAGLAVNSGVLVDQYFRTSEPDVYAIGDVANFPDAVAGRIHVEHWDNALNQGRALGRTLAGDPTPFDHVAYFFSDLFDLSLNMIGYPAQWDDIIVRGDPESMRFTVIYVKSETVRAALMINDDAHFDAWTRLVRDRQSVRAVAPLLADPRVDPLSVWSDSSPGAGRQVASSL